MAITVSKLASMLKGKGEQDKEYLIRDFVDSLTPPERGFYERIYLGIESALNRERHVTKSQQRAEREGVFIPNPSNFGLYFQIGRVMEGKPSITPAEAIAIMNKLSPKPKKKTSKRTAPILEKYKFLERRTTQHSPKEDEMKD